MSRWVDADALVERLEDVSYGMNLPRALVGLTKVLLEDFPSIDLVRCAECKHWERLNYEGPKRGWCDDQMLYSDGRWVDADDFCSYGERRE